MSMKTVKGQPHLRQTVHTGLEEREAAQLAQAAQRQRQRSKVQEVTAGGDVHHLRDNGEPQSLGSPFCGTRLAFVRHCHSAGVLQRV